MSDADRESRPEILSNMLKTVFVPIHREGWPFVGLFAVVTVVFAAIDGSLGWIGVLATAWCVYFFRDPDRVPPPRPNLALSPADGLVQSIGEAVPPSELELGAEPLPRVSVFLNVFDVHVNRVPADGLVTRTVYRPGKFFNASLDKASSDNERMSVALKLDDGREMAVIQIAGLVARRIKCELTENQRVRAGERFGIIRFGSRVDLYLPAGVTPLVAVGQRMIGGESIIADLSAPRAGEE